MASFSPLAGGPRSERAETFLLPNPGSSHKLLCSFLPPGFFSELGFQLSMALPAWRVTFMLRPPWCLGTSCQRLIHANLGSPPSLDPSLCSYGSMRPTLMDTGLDLGAVQPSGKLVALGRSLTAEGHGDREQLLPSSQPSPGAFCFWPCAGVHGSHGEEPDPSPAHHPRKEQTRKQVL